MHKILFIINRDHSYHQLSYYDDWVKCFIKHKLTQISLIDYRETSNVKNKYDFIFLHHSTNADSLKPLVDLRSFLENRDEEILIFIGNEFNNIFAPIREKRKLLKNINISYVCSMLMKDAANFLWSDVAQKKVLLTPPALNLDHFFVQKPIDNREIDIGFKGIKYYSYIGDNERNKMINTFLSVDIFKKDISFTRFDSKNWSIFLNNCRTVISSEAGSYYVDIDDNIIDIINQKIKKDTKKLIIPRSKYDRIFYKMPIAIKIFIKYLLKLIPVSHSNLVFEDSEFELFYEKYFNSLKRPEIYFKCISSRNFDAIGTMTCQILLEGKYNNILQADKHYINLKKDYSNLEDVLYKIKDKTFTTKIATDALTFVKKKHTYDKRIDYILHNITY